MGNVRVGKLLLTQCTRSRPRCCRGTDGAGATINKDAEELDVSRVTL